MLETLEIENLLIIEKVNLNFSNGFNVIIGETGSGKSIILDCLMIILGSRSSKDLIRNGAEKAKIVATFNIKNNTPLINILRENEIEDHDNLLVIKKIITKDYSKIFINDNQVTLNLILSINNHLMEIHSQFERYNLSNKDYLFYLDKFLNLNSFYPELSSSFHSMKLSKEKFIMEEERIQKIKENLEYLEETKLDLDNLFPLQNEYEELIEKRNKLFNHEKILYSINDIKSSFQDIKLRDLILNFGKQSGKIAQYISENDISELANIEKNLEQSLVFFDEGNSLFNSFAKDFYSVSNSLEPIEERIGYFRDIARKYKVQPNELFLLYERIIGEIKIINAGDDVLDFLKKDYMAKESEYLALANKISEKRKLGTKSFIDALKLHLSDLGLENANLDIIFTEGIEYTQYGLDRIDFLASMNPGIKMMPINKIASGGELSRLILSLKIIISGDSNSILFFDEIDTGVSGRVATMIGLKLKILGEKSNQIFAISHNPQVISKASHHFLVKKTVKDNLTKTEINELNYEEKVKFIASMISGHEVTDESTQSAIKLFG